MIDQLITLDKELFFFLNGLHAPWLDPIMFTLSKTWVWTPLYIFLLYHILKEYKVKSWSVLLAIGLTILLADQITSSFMKPFFERLRPTREPDMEGLIHFVNGYKGGTFGFASSHAANTFGTAMFLWLLFKTSKPWMAWLFLYATVVSYTRIYLGVHYPGDILAGGAIGILCGWMSFSLLNWLTALAEKRKKPSTH